MDTLKCSRLHAMFHSRRRRLMPRMPHIDTLWIATARTGQRWAHTHTVRKSSGASKDAHLEVREVDG